MSFDIGAIRKAHRKLVRELEAAERRTMLEMPKVVKHHVATRAKFSKKTGSRRLAQAVRSGRLRRTGAGYRFSLKGLVPNALEKGARSHWIRARRRKRLRFVHRGRFVFPVAVFHPGNPAYRFLGAAVGHAETVFMQRFRQRANAIAARF